MKKENNRKQRLKIFESKRGNYELRLNYKKRRIIIHNRYQWLNIINDGMQAVWFLIGSVLFYFGSMKQVGVTLFLIGSAQMAIRPFIRLTHKVNKRDIEIEMKNSGDEDDYQ